MIFGFNADKSKAPINLKYAGDSVVKAIESNGTETNITHIKRAIDVHLSKSTYNTGNNTFFFDTTESMYPQDYPIPQDIDIDKSIVILTGLTSESTQFVIIGKASMTKDIDDKPVIAVHFYTNKTTADIQMYGWLIEYC